MFRKAGIDAVILSHNIDAPFITHTEQKNEGLHFMRIDADLTASFKEEVAEEDSEAFKELSDSLTEVFKKALQEKGPVWIDCAISREERVLPMIPGGGTIEDMIIG